jgi:hypothetical protein
MKHLYAPAGLSAGEAEKLGDILQERLSSLIDLSLILKHVHWNVVGPGFIAVHELMDVQVESTREMVDAVAERISTSGSYLPSCRNRPGHRGHPDRADFDAGAQPLVHPSPYLRYRRTSRHRGNGHPTGRRDGGDLRPTAKRGHRTCGGGVDRLHPPTGSTSSLSLRVGPMIEAAGALQPSPPFRGSPALRWSCFAVSTLCRENVLVYGI